MKETHGQDHLGIGGAGLERYRLLLEGLLLQAGDEEGRRKPARGRGPERVAGRQGLTNWRGAGMRGPLELWLELFKHSLNTLNRRFVLR
ncbi:MAG TPA: hypothetical protein VNA27_12210 [Rubrobacteraceae bacterium]|nr:hypothetical protein [Rubrobacteraceae bacterium]